MKLIRAIVRPDAVPPITRALGAAGVNGLTVSEAAGHGAARKTAVFRGVPYEALSPMSVVDVIAADIDVDEIVRLVLEHAHTGEAGDGHVIVTPVEERYSIRTRWRLVA